MIMDIFPIPEPSGCDVDTYKASGCSGSGECTLSNRVSTGTCCTPDKQCDLDEGDCDTDEDCLGDYVCGTNNCHSSFVKTHDCCTKADHASKQMV